MKIFKDYTLTWWQIGLLKLCVFCFGIVVGAYWHEVFADQLSVILILGLVLAIYLGFALLKKSN
jgi:hypothetical protein